VKCQRRKLGRGGQSPGSPIPRCKRAILSVPPRRSSQHVQKLSSAAHPNVVRYPLRRCEVCFDSIIKKWNWLQKEELV
jgi:hypothetical protein